MTTGPTKNQYAEFGEQVVKLLNERGWNSIPKRELVLHLIHLAGNAGILDLSTASIGLARQLKVSPGVLQGLLRDRALIISPGETNYDREKIIVWLKEHNQTGYDDAQKGRIAFAVPDPVKRMQIESFFEDIGLIPDYKANSRLLVVDLGLLINNVAQRTHQDTSSLAVQIADHLQLAEDTRNKIKETGSEKKVGKLIAGSLLEQAEKRIGTKTVELFKYLYNHTNSQAR